MSSLTQLFKDELPYNMFVNFLNDICIKQHSNNNIVYIINYELFKKGLFNDTIINFIELCKNYYYKSKHTYLNKKITYKGLITVVRQLCKYHRLSYKSQIVYDRSKYNIVYYITLKL